jgi:hypothetical protein
MALVYTWHTQVMATRVLPNDVERSARVVVAVNILGLQGFSHVFRHVEL